MIPKCCINKESAAELKDAVKFLKVMADDNRLKILCILRQGELCVCEIWQHLCLPQNLTSHHLKILKDFNLIESRKEGLKVFYSINKRVISNHSKLLTKFLRK